jgi:hypothetical protein
MKPGTPRGRSGSIHVYTARKALVVSSIHVVIRLAFHVAPFPDACVGPGPPALSWLPRLPPSQA